MLRVVWKRGSTIMRLSAFILITWPLNVKTLQVSENVAAPANKTHVCPCSEAKLQARKFPTCQPFTFIMVAQHILYTAFTLVIYYHLSADYPCMNRSRTGLHSHQQVCKNWPSKNSHLQGMSHHHHCRIHKPWSLFLQVQMLQVIVSIACIINTIGTEVATITMPLPWEEERMLVMIVSCWPQWPAPKCHQADESR